MGVLARDAAKAAMTQQGCEMRDREMKGEGRPIRGREVKHFFTRARTPTSPVDARYMHKNGYNKLNNLFRK